MRFALPRKIGVLITSAALLASLSPIAAPAADSPLNRKSVIARAKTWTTARVPYSQLGYLDGYRRDCSGFVSMAWGLPENLVTWRIPLVAKPITKAEILPGDVLLDYQSGAKHVVIFEKWANAEKTAFWVLESTGQNGVDSAIRRVVPYPYRVNKSYYKPWRYVSMDRYWAEIPLSHRQPVGRPTPIEVPTAQKQADDRARKAAASVQSPKQPVPQASLDAAALNRKLADLNGDGAVQAVETTLPIAPPLTSAVKKAKRAAPTSRSAESSASSDAGLASTDASPSVSATETFRARWIEAEERASRAKAERDAFFAAEESPERPERSEEPTAAEIPVVRLSTVPRIGVPSPIEPYVSPANR